jgi:hypothetical protein
MKIDIILPIKKYSTKTEKTIKYIRQAVGCEARIIAIDNYYAGDSSIEKLLIEKDLYLKEPIPGYARAMNAPIRQGVKFSEFVGIMNDDDATSRNRFRDQMEALTENRRDIAICEMKKTYSNFSVPSRYGTLSYEYWHPHSLLLGYFGSDATLLARRDWINEAGYRNEQIHPDLVDYEYLLRNYENDSLVALSKKLYSYRQHRGQMSVARASNLDFMEIEKTVSAFVGKIKFSKIKITEIAMLFPLNHSSSGHSKEELIDSGLKFRKSLRMLSLEESCLKAYENLIDIRELRNVHTKRPSEKFKADYLATRDHLRSL